MTTLAVAFAQPTRGWAGPIALLIAIAAFIAIATLHDHYFGDGRDPSPTGEGRPRRGVKPQVARGVDTDDTDADPTGWWGRIVNHDGRRVRVAGVDEPDPEIDLDLDDEEDETLEDYIAEADRRDVPYAKIVREAMARYRVSESTAKRRIREVRAAAR